MIPEKGLERDGFEMVIFLRGGSYKTIQIYSPMGE